MGVINKSTAGDSSSDHNPEPTHNSPIEQRWKHSKAVKISLLVLGVVLVAAIIIIPIAATKTGVFGKKQKSQEALKISGSKRLVVVMNDRQQNVLLRLPAPLAQFITNNVLKTSGIQILEFESSEVLVEAYKHLLEDKSVELVLQDRKLKHPQDRAKSQNTPISPEARSTAETIDGEQQTGNIDMVEVKRNGEGSENENAIPLSKGEAARDPVYNLKKRRVLQTGGSFAQPNDEMYKMQDYLQNKVQFSAQVEGAWAYTRGLKSIVVAVVDTGVDYTNPDLAPVMWKNPNEIKGNKVDDDKNGKVDDWMGWNFGCRNNDPKDDEGHGTNVAGIIAAVANNKKFFAGVAEAQIMAIRLSNCYDNGFFMSDVLDGFNYATRNGAKFISASVGDNKFDDGIPPKPPSLSSEASQQKVFIQAAEAAFKKNNGVILSAAGNNAANLDEAVARGWASPPCTVQGPNVLCVGASSALGGEQAYFSAYGVNIVHVFARGEAICNLLPMNQIKPGEFNEYCWDGTSQATPIVTGIGVLITSILAPFYNNNITAIPAESIVDVIKRTVNTKVKLPAATGGSVDGTKAVEFIVNKLYGNAIPKRPTLPTLTLQGFLKQNQYVSPVAVNISRDATTVDFSKMTLQESRIFPATFPISNISSLAGSNRGFVEYTGIISMPTSGLAIIQLTWSNEPVLIIEQNRIQLNKTSSTTYRGKIRLEREGYYNFKLITPNPTSKASLDFTWLQPGMESAARIKTMFFIGDTDSSYATARSLPAAPATGFALYVSRVGDLITAGSGMNDQDLILRRSSTVPAGARTLTGTKFNFSSQGSLMKFLTGPNGSPPSAFGVALGRLRIQKPATSTIARFNFQVVCPACKLYLGSMFVTQASTTIKKPVETGCISIEVGSSATRDLEVQIDFVANPLVKETALQLQYKSCDLTTYSWKPVW